MAHPMSILIVDHEQPSRIAVETMLDCIGLTCRSVSSAQEALDCLASHPTDIVLTNLVMPIMSGLALLDAVVTKYPDTTFILMSSQGTISRAVQAIKRGAYDFIEKPIDPNELTALVQRAAQYRAIRAQSRVLTEVTQQWEATFDAVPDLVAILDADQRFVRINRAMANILGCQPYDVVGRPWQEWQEVAPVSAIFSSTDDAGEMREIAVPTLKMCLLTSRSPLSDVNGHSIGTVYVARDITRQKIAEDALRDSEQRLRSIYEGSNDAIMLLTEDGFFDCNLRTLHMLGLETKKAFVALHPADISPPTQPDGRDSLKAARELIRQAYTEGAISFEWEHKRADGSQFPADVRLTPFSYNGQKALHATVTDISQQKRAQEALKDSEARIRAITDSAREAIIMINDKGAISFWNPAAERILGYAQHEVLGKDLHRLIGPKRYYKAFRESFTQFQKTGRGTVVGKTLELEAIRKDGNEISIQLSLSAVKLDGAWHGVGILRDISEWKTIQEALKASEEFNRSLIDNICIGVSVINHDMQIVAMNRQMKKWFPGADPADRPLCHSSFKDFPDENVCSFCPVVKTFKDGRLHSTIAHASRAGANIDFRITASPIKDASDRVTSVIEIVEDVTERVQSENDLKRSHDEIERLLSSMSSFVIGLDEDLTIRRWNSAAEKTFGLNAHDVVGKKTKDINIGLDWNFVATQAPDWPLVRQTIRLPEMRYKRQDNTDGLLGITLNPIKAESGEAEGFFLLGTDMTDRRALEMQLVQAQKLESIGQLAAGIAHEINTPTQYVGDNLEFLKEAFANIGKLIEAYGNARPHLNDATLAAELEKTADEMDIEYFMSQIPRAISQSLDGVSRVTNIVRAMKEFSHPDIGEKVPVDINKAIESTITVARNEWKYVAELVTNLDPDLPHVACLAGELNQAILNIIINASHAIKDVVGESGEKGRITVSTKRNGQWAQIQISDTGTGIPDHARNRVFDPFFTTKDVGVGTGQGLAIVRNVIVEKHGGTISFESDTGKGTTFTIQIPIEE